jgi:catechol-2,3-dioxygenase
MEIKLVVLQTKNLMEMKKFYVDTLGFSLINQDKISFRIAVGTSELEFTTKETVGNPFYHFALNIPANKFIEAKSWTKERVYLTVEDEKDEAQFLHADALYFYDPAGNIVEFISRHLVNEDSLIPFSINSIVNISEINLTVNDLVDASKQLNEIGVTERDNKEIGKGQLNFMGNKKKGIFLLLTEPGRKWLFSDKLSTIHPLEIILTNNHKIVIDSDNELQIYPGGKGTKVI